jgi:hypothetical protein
MNSSREPVRDYSKFDGGGATPADARAPSTPATSFP